MEYSGDDMIKDLSDCTMLGIDHIGIAVSNLEEAMHTYSNILGLGCEGIEEIEEQKVVIGKILIGGVRIELLQPTQSDGPISKFIGKRGEGIHHLAFGVENIDGCLRDLEAKGVDLIDTEARIGADGAKIAFLHPKGSHGVLVELVERERME